MARTFKPLEIKISADSFKFHGNEPSLAQPFATAEQRRSQLIRSFNWYNYVTESKEQRRFYEDWIQVFRPDTAASDLARLAKISDRNLAATPSYLARLAVLGLPLDARELELILAQIQQETRNSLETPLCEAPAKPERTGVQERIDQQVNQAVADIEDTVSELLRGTRTAAKTSNIAGFSKFSAVHFQRLERALERTASELRELVEVRAARDLTDSQEQLLEGYRWVRAPHLRAAVAFLDECAAAAARLAIEKKVARVRKAKPMDRAKLVRKLRHLAEHRDLGLTSIKPVEILGTSEVWVYDVRKRKLGVYRGEFSNSIMVKGSSIIGTAAKSCLQKTLRKPEVQLAEFMKLSKSQLKKWFESIKGVEHELKPRTNEHMILLRTG